MLLALYNERLKVYEDDDGTVVTNLYIDGEFISTCRYTKEAYQEYKEKHLHPKGWKVFLP